MRESDSVLSKQPPAKKEYHNATALLILIVSGAGLNKIQPSYFNLFCTSKPVSKKPPFKYLLKKTTNQLIPFN